MEWTVAIGVDTHKDAHVAVALDALGAQLDSREIATTLAGYSSCSRWAQELGVPAFAIEGTGSYGAGLARFLERAGVSVYECERPRRAGAPAGQERSHRRGAGRAAAARGERLSLPAAAGGARTCAAAARAPRRHAGAHRCASTSCSALLVTAPDARARAPCGALRGALAHDGGCGCGRARWLLNGVLRRLGRARRATVAEMAETERALAALVAELAPELLDECGVGPVCAAQLLVSSGEPSRMTSEASFAALAGTSPVDASSGNQRRHRLNRGGDRQLNWALHMIALQRIHYHAETAAYYERLLASGKTPGKHAAASSARSPATSTAGCAKSRGRP